VRAHDGLGSATVIVKCKKLISMSIGLGLAAVAAGLLIASLPVQLLLYLGVVVVVLGLIVVFSMRPVLGAYLFLFALPLEYFQSPSIVTSTTILGLILALCWLAHLLLNRRKVRWPKISFWALITLFSVVSILWSADREAGLRLAYALSLMLIMSVILFNLVDTMKKVETSLLVLAISAFVFLGISSFRFMSTSDASRLMPISGLSPNHYVAFSVFVLFPCFCALALRHNSLPVSLLLIFCALGAFVPSLLAGAEASVLSLILSSVIVVVLVLISEGHGAFSFFPLALLAVSAIVASCVLLHSGFYYRIAIAFASPGVFGGREWLWPAYLTQWAERPLVGWGIGQSISPAGLRTAIVTGHLIDPLGLSYATQVAPHGILIWSIVDLGIAGLILALSAYLITIQKVWRVTRTRLNRRLSANWVRYSTIGVVLYMLAMATVEDMIFKKVFWVSIILLEIVSMSTFQERQLDATRKMT
jgi:hypothetical protein